jgi:alpha-tubulin suppressor-like RCC1 family protein
MMKKLLSLLSVVLIGFNGTTQTALDFDGINDHVLIPGAGALLNGDNTWSIEFWVQDPDNSCYPFAINATDYVLIQPTGTIVFYSAGGTFQSNNATWIADGNPHHVAFVSYGVNNQQIFVDGNPVGMQSQGHSGFTGIAAEDFSIGSDLVPSTQIVDDFRIWDDARTPAEILANYNVCLTGSEPNLILLYNFEDGTGSSNVTNLASAGPLYNGILTNMDAATDWVAGLNGCATNPNHYWVGGTGNWSDAANHWASTSGGAPGSAGVPGATDNAIFDANSGLTLASIVTIDQIVEIDTLDFSGVLNQYTYDNTLFDVTLHGSLFGNPSGVLTTGTWGEIIFDAAASGEDITSGGTIWAQDFRIIGAQINITDDLDLTTGTLFTDNGGFVLNSNSLACAQFISNTTNTRTIDISNSTVDVTEGVWNMVGTNVTLTATSSSILLGDLAGVADFTGGALGYDTLRSNTATTLNYFNDNTFKLVEVVPASQLLIDNGDDLSTDSLIIAGDCLNTATLSTPGAGPDATFTKTGFPGITLTRVDINKVNALGGGTYNVIAGTITSSTGWTSQGGNFYWIGNTGNWNDGNNWSYTSGGPANGCIPTSADSVYFDANSFVGAGNIVTVDDTAFFRSMDWSAIIGNQTLLLDSSMMAHGDVTLAATLSLTRNISGGNSAGIQFNQPAVITSNSAALIDAGFLLSTANSTDIVSLADALVMTDSSSVTLFNGHFDSNDQFMFTGSLNSINNPATGSDLRTISFGASEIQLLGEFYALGDTTLTLNAGTSHLIIGDTLNYANSLKTTGTHTFNDVTLNFVPTAQQQQVLGNNTYNIFRVLKGSAVYFDSTGTQTVTDSLILKGTCRDSIFIYTVDPAFVNTANINKTTTATDVVAECLNIRGINATGQALTTFFSTNSGANTNITFSPLPAVNISFAPDSTISSFCYGDTVYFNNSSSAYYSPFSDLLFSWTVNDGSLPILDTAAAITAGQVGAQLNYSQSAGVSSSSYTQLNGWTEITDPQNIFIPATGTAQTTAGNEAMKYTFTVGYRMSLVNGTGSNAHLVDMDNNAATVQYDYKPKVKIFKNGAEFGVSSPLTAFNTHNFLEGTLNNGATQIGVDTVTFSMTGSGLTPSDLLTIQMGSDVSYVSTALQPRWKDGTLITANDVTVNYRFDIDTIFVTATPLTANFITDSLIHQFASGGDSIVVGLTAIDPINFCAATDTFYIDITRPNISLLTSEPDTTLCPWQEVTHEAYSAVAGTSFEFFINGVSQNTPSVNDTLLVLNNLSDQDTISVLAYENGCVSDVEPQFIYTVFTAPSFTWSSTDADTSICIGDTVVFTTSTNPAYTYAFELNGNPVSAFMSTTGTYTTGSLADNDTVYVIGKDGNACTDTLNMIFNVDPLPGTTLAESSGGNVICTGQSVTFTASGADQYEFFINDVSVQALSATATFTTSSLTANDTVSVVGVNNNGCQKYAAEEYYYIVLPNPTTAVSVSDPDSSICSGTLVSFTGSNASQYEFFLNGISVQGPSSNSIYNTDTLSNNDQIYVVGTLGACSATSSSITMNVNTAPTTTLSNDDDGDNKICAGTTVTFTANGATNYEFFIDGISQGLPSTTNTFTTSTLLNGQTISVMGESNTCYLGQQQTFTVLTVPNVQLFTSDIDNTICEGGNISFTAANAAQYEFFVDGVSYQGPSSNNSLVNPALPVGNLEVVVIGTAGNGCTDSSVVIPITVNPTPTITGTSSDLDNTICAGESVTFTGTGGDMYQFLLNGVPQGVLSPSSTFTTTGLTNGQSMVVYGTLLGCPSTSAPIVTTVNPIPATAINSTDIDNIYCESDLVTYTATGAANYEFIINSVSQGAPSPVNTINSSGFTPGSYFVQVIGTTIGCSSTAQTNVTVNALPNTAISSSDIDNVICQGESVAYTGSGAALYEFFVNIGSQGASSPNPMFNTNALGNGDVVSVVGYSAQGCIQSAVLSAITVNPNPSVTLVSSDLDQAICQGDNVDFTAAGANDYEFFINGVSQGAPSPTNTLSTSGLVNGDIITVTGSSLGCSGTAAPMNFNVYGFPVVSIFNNGDSQFCTGELTDIIASGAANYQFLINGTPVGPYSPVNTFNGVVNNGDVITVNGETNGCSSVSTSNIAYTVLTYPTLVSSSSDADNIICLDDLITFSASGGTEYDFALNGNSLQYGVTSTYDISTLVNGDVISITAYNGDCPSAVDNYTFTVNSMVLDLTATPSNMICTGEAVTFTATGADQYEFFLNGTSTGAMSATNTYTSTTLLDEDEITFVGYSNTTLCTQNYSDYIIMNVMDDPSITAMSATDFCEGDSVILVSNGAYGNQWYLNGAPIAGATDTSYVAYTSGDYSLETTAGGLGTLWSFGLNADGTFANGSNLNAADPTPATTTITMDEISAGGGFLLGVSTTGEVYAWGDNSSGQLGNGTYTSSNTAIMVPSLTGIKTVATTEMSAMAITSGGDVYVWGNNAEGQLGTGNTAVINFPFLNASLANTDSIAGGRRHYVILKNDGTVWTVGNNDYGQLGQGNLTGSMSPVQVTGLTGVVSVGAGEYHSFAIDNTGDLYVWGNNGSGQLGLDDLTNRLTPTLSGLRNVNNAQGGANHSVFLTSDKKVFTSGGNAFGQLGTGNYTASTQQVEVAISGAEMISAGQYSTLVKRADNTVFGFGNNTEDQLSSASGLTVPTPEYINDLDGVGYIEAGWSSSHFLFTEANACVSTTVNVNVSATPVPVITANGDTLSTIAGTSYQWYFNGNIIPGATNQTHIANAGGEYFVEVTNALGCAGTSAVYTVSLANVKDILVDRLNIYPNPASNQLTVEVPESIQSSFSIVIYDHMGRIVYNEEMSNKTDIQIDLQAFESGVYHLILHNTEQHFDTRFVRVDEN